MNRAVQIIDDHATIIGFYISNQNVRFEKVYLNFTDSDFML